MVTLAVAVIVALAAIWVWEPRSTPGRPLLTVSGNIQVDRIPGSSNSGLQGVEPDVAVSANGSLGIAWIGFDPIVPTLYFNQTSNFTTGIWFAESEDGGQTFSAPELVSGGCQQCVDPSLVFGPDGTAFVCYLATPSATHTVLLSYQLPGQTEFASVMVATGAYLDRPWIVEATTGSLEVAYDSPNGIYLAQSPVGSPHFSPDVLVLNLDGLIGSFGQAPGGSDFFGVLTDGQVNFAMLPAGASQATATKTVPINVTGSVSTQAEVLSKPGPSVAASASETFMTYVSNNDTALWLVTSTDSGATWSAPELIASTTYGTIAMPSLALNAAGSTLLLVWLGGNDGDRNTYAAALSTQRGGLSATVQVSSENGYPNTVRSWHGDFMGVAFVGNSTAAVTWSDGRGGLSADVGFGHVYSAVVTVSGMT